MLKSLEPNYQRYTIDKHLKRYRKALTHLSKCGQSKPPAGVPRFRDSAHVVSVCPGDDRFPEVLQLVKEQKLFSEALQLYTAGGPHYRVDAHSHTPLTRQTRRSDSNSAPLISRPSAAPMPSTCWSSSRRSRLACSCGAVASCLTPCGPSPVAAAGGTPSVWRSRSRCRVTMWPCWPVTWQVSCAQKREGLSNFRSLAACPASLGFRKTEILKKKWKHLSLKKKVLMLSSGFSEV